MVQPQVAINYMYKVLLSFPPQVFMFSLDVCEVVVVRRNWATDGQASGSITQGYPRHQLLRLEEWG